MRCYGIHMFWNQTLIWYTNNLFINTKTITLNKNHERIVGMSSVVATSFITQQSYPVEELEPNKMIIEDKRRLCKSINRKNKTLGSMYSSIAAGYSITGLLGSAAFHYGQNAEYDLTEINSFSVDSYFEISPVGFDYLHQVYSGSL